MSHEPAIAFEIENLFRELETLAEGGKWSELAALLRRRDKLLSKVTNVDRATIVGAAIQNNNRLLKLARADQQAVARQLTTLRRSRDAVDRYQSHRNTNKASPDL